MEQMVGLLAKRLLEKLVVNFFDLRIRMRLPELLARIFFIDSVNTRQTNSIIGVARLTSPTDTTARTSHNLNKMIIRLTFFDLI